MGAGQRFTPFGRRVAKTRPEREKREGREPAGLWPESGAQWLGHSRGGVRWDSVGPLEQRERLAGVGLARWQTMDICKRGRGLGTRENGNRASVYSAGEMEPLGQADSQAPQSMHFSGSMV